MTLEWIKAQLTLRRSSIVYVVILLSLTALYAAGDRIPFSDGFGLDGREYGEATLNWSKPDYRPDQRIIRRALPPAAVHYGLRALGQDLTKPNVISGFIALNLICIAIALACWNITARRLGWSDAAKSFGAIGLTVNFALWKWNAYYPVLTDTAAFAIGAIMMASYFARARLVLLVATLASAFVWQTGPYIGLLLLAFPSVQDVSSDPAEPAGDNRGVALLLAAASALAVTIYVATRDAPRIFPTLDWTGFANPMQRTASIALVFIWVFFGCYFGGKAAVSSIRARGLSIDYLWLIAGVVCFEAVSRFQDSYAAQGAQGFMSPSSVLNAVAALSVQRPLVFFVAHVAYFGPVVIVAALLWPQLTRAAQRYGLGLLTVLAFTLIFAMNSESRHLILVLPIIAALVTIVASEIELARNWKFLLAFGLTSVWLAKPWLTIGAMKTGTPDGWPDVLFYMHLGPWMPGQIYWEYLGIAALIAYVLHTFVGQATQAVGHRQVQRPGASVFGKPTSS